MLDYLDKLPELVAALFAAGWGWTAWHKKKDRENHEARMAKAQAELTASLRDSETKYTREALEIYTRQVVDPLRQQLDRNTQAIARYQGAIDCAPECRIYPDCVIVRKLRSSQKNYGNHANGSQDVARHFDADPAQED